MITKTRKLECINEALQLRAYYLNANPRAFSKRGIPLTQYVRFIDEKFELTRFQKEVMAGIVGSDGTFALSTTGRTARIKLQHTHKVLSYVEFLRDVLLELMTHDRPIPPPSVARDDMLSWYTFTCNQVYKIINPIFYNNRRKKGIFKEELRPLFGPVFVATMFCGDGSLVQGEVGKGFGFNLQGFTHDEIKAFCELLSEELGIKAKPARDGVNSKGKDQYYVYVNGPSYDDFVRVVGPYIHPAYHYRVPTGRSEYSKVVKNPLTPAMRDQLLGSKLRNNYPEIVDTYDGTY